MTKQNPTQTIIHKSEGEIAYDKEIGIIGLNHSVYLKSNDRRDELKSMVVEAINIYSWLMQQDNE